MKIPTSTVCAYEIRSNSLNAYKFNKLFFVFSSKVDMKIRLRPSDEQGAGGTAEFKPMSVLSPGDIRSCLVEGWSYLPKGSMVMALHWHTNRDQTLWEDPLDFNPERFIDSDGAFSMSKNLMPFQVRMTFLLNLLKAKFQL